MKQFSRKIVIIMGSLACLLLCFWVSSLVWGKTIRMAQANRHLTSGALPQARKIYEDLTVELPNSPYVLHNLGLAAYREGKTAPAAEYFQKALGKLKPDRSKSKQFQELRFKLPYHLGLALFKQAEAADQNPPTGKVSAPNPKSPVELYRKALEQFKNAIKINPSDVDAKYNYELTLLRVKEAENKQQSENQDPKNQNRQNNKDQKDQKNQPDSKNQGQKQPDQQKQNQDSNPQNQKDQNAANQSNQSSKPEQGKQQPTQGMTKEEAQRLLNMAENGDQYMAPVIRDDRPVQKDW